MRDYPACINHNCLSPSFQTCSTIVVPPALIKRRTRDRVRRSGDGRWVTKVQEGRRRRGRQRRIKRRFQGKSRSRWEPGRNIRWVGWRRKTVGERNGEKGSFLSPIFVHFLIAFFSTYASFCFPLTSKTILLVLFALSDSHDLLLYRPS